MAKKKVCINCKLFVLGETCTSCKGNQFTANWQGRVYINNPEKSIIAQKMGITEQGEYAVKVK